MGNCATRPKVSKSGEDTEAPIPPPEDAALVTEKKEELATREVDLTAEDTKVEPTSTGEVVSTEEVVGLAVVTAVVAKVVVEGGGEEVIEKVKEVVVEEEEESTAEDAAGSKRLSLSNLLNMEKEVCDDGDKTSSEPTKKVEPSSTKFPTKESESEKKEATAEEPPVAAETVAVDTPTPLVAKEKVIEVAEEATEKKTVEETKAS